MEKREEIQGTDLFLETGEAKDLKRNCTALCWWFLQLVSSA